MGVASPRTGRVGSVSILGEGDVELVGGERVVEHADGGDDDESADGEDLDSFFHGSEGGLDCVFCIASEVVDGEMFGYRVGPGLNPVCAAFFVYYYYI